jgi:hypothetical protein
MMNVSLEPKPLSAVSDDDVRLYPGEAALRDLADNIPEFAGVGLGDQGEID